jgi:integrase
MVHLREHGASVDVIRQTVCGLRFLYLRTLGKEWQFHQVPYPRKGHRLPHVPDREVILRFLGGIANIKHRALLTTCYGAGLRVSEARHLKVTDIDGQRGVIHIHLGKGMKDRLVPLSDTLREVLRANWRAVRPHEWLFPIHPDAGADGDALDHEGVPDDVQEARSALFEDHTADAATRRRDTPHGRRHERADDPALIGQTSLRSTPDYKGCRVSAA